MSRILIIHCHSPTAVQTQSDDADHLAAEGWSACNGAVQGFICIGAFFVKRGRLIRQTGSFVCQCQTVIRQFLFARVDFRVRGYVFSQRGGLFAADGKFMELAEYLAEFLWCQRVRQELLRLREVRQ